MTLTFDCLADGGEGAGGLEGPASTGRAGLADPEGPVEKPPPPAAANPGNGACAGTGPKPGEYDIGGLGFFSAAGHQVCDLAAMRRVLLPMYLPRRPCWPMRDGRSAV